MPSHGFYIRHVKGIELDNIDIRTAKEDRRPAFVLDDVQDSDFSRIRVPRVADVPAFSLRNVTEFNVHSCNAVPDTRVEKAEQKKI